MKGSQIDLKQLRAEIQSMKYWHPLFKILKEELSKLGYWRNKERGNPKLGYQKSRKNEQI